MRRLKTVRRPPIYPNGAQAISPVAPSPLFRCPHAVHRCPSVDSGLRIAGAQFDAVSVHDAVSYLTSEDDVRAMAATAAIHCRPHGGVLVVPDHVRERFAPPYVEHGGHDATDGRSMRYLMWTTDPDPSDSTYLADFAYLLRDSDGTARVEHDRHVLGIFSESLWTDALEGAGFHVAAHTGPWARTFSGTKRAN